MKTYEVLQCEVCGEIDCIRSNGDCGYCTECHSVESYKTIFVNEDGEVMKEGEP